MAFQQEQIDIERFHYIIVCTAFKPIQSTLQIDTGSQKDDRDMRRFEFPLQALAHHCPADTRHHHVADDKVRLHLSAIRIPSSPSHALYTFILDGESLFQYLQQIFIVFHKQYGKRHLRFFRIRQLIYRYEIRGNRVSLQFHLVLALVRAGYRLVVLPSISARASDARLPTAM